MTKILATIGPVSDGKRLKFIVKRTQLIRFNTSHNSLKWHEQNINQIKKIDPNKLILVDIPGIKPRTSNIKSIQIKKGAIVKFSNRKKAKNIIQLSNPTPKIKKKTKYFSLSDGTYQFRFKSFKNNILSGVSLQNFNLEPKKGLNIPFSIYNNYLQEKKYLSFLKKINKFNFDCLGLSFIQNAKILTTLKKKYPEKIFISKIENYLGYVNRKEIIKYSDAIMIDRGDLSAEIGISNLTEYVENIIKDAKAIGKPIIIATENLNSLISKNLPNKSDITNIDYYIFKKIDYLMLSDETATSKNWKNTIQWLSVYLKQKRNKAKVSKSISIEQIIKTLENQTLVIFSKKGYFYEKISSLDISNLVVFTENKNLCKKIKLKKNSQSIYIKFPKKNLYNFLFKNIKKNKEKIFKNHKTAYLTNVIFPRKDSRANSISIIKKKDF